MRRIFLAVALLLAWVAAAWGAPPPEIVLESARYTKTSQDVDFDAIVPYQKMLLTFTFNTNESVIFLDVNIVTGARRDASTITITAIGGLKHGAQFELMSLEEGSITLTARNITGESSTFTQTMKAIEGTPPEETEAIKVKLTPSEIRLNVGEQIEVTASGDPEITIFNDATWEIDNKSVASVEGDFPFFAYVRGIQNGETLLKYTVHDRIQDTYGTATAKVIVGTVTPPASQDVTPPASQDITPPASQDITPQGSITLNKDILQLYVGQSETLTATVTGYQAPVIWGTSDTAIATVSNGTVNAIAFGDAIITARAGDNVASCNVFVRLPDTKGEPDSGGSGGGCNAGFLGLAALAAMAMKKR